MPLCLPYIPYITYTPYIPYIWDYAHPACLPRLACQTLPYACQALETHQPFQNAPKRSEAVPDQRSLKRSQTLQICYYAYAYLYIIHTYGIMLLSLPSLPTAPIRSQSARNAFNGAKTLQASPKRSETVPNYLSAPT